jgi:hypothetical protein
VLAYHGRRSESHLSRYPVDRQVGRFEQALGAANTRASDPERGRGTNLRAKAPAESPGAHGRVPRDGRQRQILAEVQIESREERTDCRTVARRRLVDDELRLPAGTFERHDCLSSHARRHLGAEIAPHEMDAQV